MAGRPMMRHDRMAWAFAFGLVLVMSCCPPALAQSMIGTAAAVKNDVHGVRGSAIRTLASGGDVFSDDLVKTGDASLAQLLFVDQTTITVAANSEALLKTVFHPKEGYKQLVLKTVVGAFRYVSGVQKPQHTQIEFPFGYLTVRGTIVDILLSPTRAIIVLEEGAVTVVPYATGVHYNLDRPGTNLVVSADGHVDGPMTTDSTIMKITGQVPFTLFGSTIWPSQQLFQQIDSQRDLNDFTNGSRCDPAAPPPPGVGPLNSGCTSP